MKPVLNVYVSTDSKTKVETFHPYVEAKLAKKKCDEIFKVGGEHNVVTVSTDATSVYYDYGKKIGIKVNLFLNNKKVTIAKMFKSYNKALDYYYKLFNL